MPETTVLAAEVCRRRHPLEWIAPEPRTAPCDDCTQVVRLVIESSVSLR